MVQFYAFTKLKIVWGKGRFGCQLGWFWRHKDRVGGEKGRGERESGAVACKLESSLAAARSTLLLALLQSEFAAVTRPPLQGEG